MNRSSKIAGPVILQSGTRDNYHRGSMGSIVDLFDRRQKKKKVFENKSLGVKAQSQN